MKKRKSLRSTRSWSKSRPNWGKRRSIRRWLKRFPAKSQEQTLKAFTSKALSSQSRLGQTSIESKDLSSRTWWAWFTRSTSTWKRTLTTIITYCLKHWIPSKWTSLLQISPMMLSRKKSSMLDHRRPNWIRMLIKSLWDHCLSTSYLRECSESTISAKRKRLSSKRTLWSMLLNHSTLTNFSESYICLRRKRKEMTKIWSKTNSMRQMNSIEIPSSTR